MKSNLGIIEMLRRVFFLPLMRVLKHSPKIKNFLKKVQYQASAFKHYREYHNFNFDIHLANTKNTNLEIKGINSKLLPVLTNARFSDGTLLGLIRDGRLIPHDNDVDIDVEYASKNVKAILEYAKNLNWTLGRKVEYFNRIQQLTFYDDHNDIYDFIFWSVDKRFCINFSEPGSYRVMPSEYLNDLKNIEVIELGLITLVPRKTKEWAIYRYGSSWDVPEGSKGAWQETCGDIGDAWWIT
ncbi:hypothetical protein N9769_01135 [Ascidiaceihabitans sp.]|nr:hypothetical protein [Ascidiaceihabitans sp.]